MTLDDFKRRVVAACDGPSVAAAVQEIGAHVDRDPDRQEVQYRLVRDVVEEAARAPDSVRYARRIAVHDLLLRERRFVPPTNDSSYLHFFDEAFYLQKHPDVAAAVTAGAYRSGFQHFVQFGASEGRKAHGWRAVTMLAPRTATRRATDETRPSPTRLVLSANEPRGRVAPEQAFGINFIGFHSANLGLGVSARAYYRFLVENGFDVCPIDVSVPGGRSGHDLSYADAYLPLDLRAPHAVNLFLMNPKDIEDQLLLGCPAIDAKGRINVALPFWELARLPRNWVPILDRMDLVLAASPFVKHALMMDVNGPAIRDLDHPLYLPASVRADRARWNIPESATTFVSSFEMASDVNRKNPFAALQAFEKALRGDPRALLIVKVNNAKWTPDFDPHMAALREFAQHNTNIRLLDEVLGYEDVLSLFASCDVLVSLHRAEGLGLCLMEAMTLGKPVIATGWSGNMVFTNEQNSCLVGYDLIPVQNSTQAAYATGTIREDATWANARIDEAAAWMSRLAKDPALRAGIGRRAAADMAAYQSRIDANEVAAAVRHIADRRGIRL